MSRCLLPLLPALLSSLAAAITGLPATAAPAPTLTVAPAEVQLCAGRERLVRATLSEGLFKQAPTLNASSDAGVEVRLEAVGTPAGAAATWMIKVLPAAAAAAVPGTLHLTASGPGAPPLGASIALKTPDAAGAFPARLEVHGAAESLPERATLRLHLVLGNSAAAPLRVDALRVVDEGRPFEVKAAAPLAAVTVVPPGGALILPFDVQVGATTPSAGKHRLVFQADVSGEFDGCPRRASLVATRDLGFLVIGESAALTALAIPSFLLVPGALCLLVPAVLWRFGWRLPGHDKDERFPLGPGTPEFWTLAVTLSIIGFALVTWLGVRADVLVAYRLRDVVLVWLGSVLVGLFWYLPARHVLVEKQKRRDAAARALQAQRQWQAGETPLAVLQRLARRSAGLEQAQQPLNASALGLDPALRVLFELELDAERAWLCPAIVIDADAAPPAVQNAIEDARNAKDADQLQRVLASADAQAVRLSWLQGGAWPIGVEAQRYQAARNGQRVLESLVRSA